MDTPTKPEKYLRVVFDLEFLIMEEANNPKATNKDVDL